MAEKKTDTVDELKTELPVEPMVEAEIAMVTEEPVLVEPGACVVDDGTPHTGRAVNGMVCSQHAIHYDRLGRRRG